MDNNGNERQKPYYKDTVGYNSAEKSKDRRAIGTALVFGAAGATIAAKVVANGVESGIIQNAANGTVDMASSTVQDIGKLAEKAVVIPVDKAVDTLGNILPQDKEGDPRIPNKILLGQVEIKVSPDLNVRKSPSIPDDADSPNSLSWDKVQLANRVESGGKITYEKVDFQKGDTLVVKNPEIVSGQYTGGGNGIGEDKSWIQLYTVDDDGQPHAVFVNFQSETRSMVSEIKDDPTKPTEYITAKTLQNDGPNGVRVVLYDKTLPSEIDQITVEPTNSSTSSSQESQ